MPPATARPVVIKIGGRSLEAPGAPEELAAEVASLSDEALLVHGGGNEVSEWCERLDIHARFVDGLRVTDAATLEAAVAVLAGLANKRLVARLRAAGIDAVGLSLLDGGIAEVVPHPEADTLGSVGRVHSVDTSLLDALLAEGRMPVLSSIGAHRGSLLNLNADDVAAAIAAALHAPTLVLLSDAPGVLVEGRVMGTLVSAELDHLLEHPDVRGGMVAKLNAARYAMEHGVARVRIASWSGPGTLKALIEGDGAGTTLLASASMAGR